MRSKTILETERLVLREMNLSDEDDIAGIICDAETMRFFPSPYDRKDVLRWIERNLERYRTEGSGLWAVVLKSTGEVVGDCGLIWQDVDGDRELECGYHFKRSHWGNGYATEAALACIRYGFDNRDIKRIISLIRPENEPSARVAVRNGLRVEKQTIRAGLLHDVYVIERR